jgi:hypothetical protein
MMSHLLAPIGKGYIIPELINIRTHLRSENGAMSIMVSNAQPATEIKALAHS